jgi:hypothetical protein
VCHINIINRSASNFFGKALMVCWCIFCCVVEGSASWCIALDNPHLQIVICEIVILHKHHQLARAFHLMYQGKRGEWES